jgi:hypothetical protein
MNEMRKKKIIIFIIILFIITTVLPITVCSKINNNFKSVDIKDQYQEYGDHPIWLSNNIPQWQEFIPTKNNLVKVEIKIKQANMESSPLILEIHNPYGYKLTYQEINTSEIPDVPSWVSFDFPDISVYPGGTYFINVLYKGIGEYAWYGTWEDKYPNGGSSRDPDWDFCFRTYTRNFPPNQPIRPIGNINLRTGLQYEFLSLTTDPDEDNINYLFDWGDGNDSGWLGPFSSGEAVIAKYSWSKQGTFEIKVKARDEFNQEGDWSDSLAISVSKSKTKNSPFLIFLENHPHLFPLIRQILGLKI